MSRQKLHYLQVLIIFQLSGHTYVSLFIIMNMVFAATSNTANYFSVHKQLSRSHPATYGAILQ